MANNYHIFKRWYTNSKGKKYYYWWYWYYQPITGKQIRKPAGRACTNKGKAEEFISNLPEIVPPANVHTVKELAENMFKNNSEWMKRKAEFADGLKESTRKAYDGNVRNHILPQFGERDISTIKASEIEDYLLELNKKNQRLKTLSLIHGTSFSRKQRGENI